MFDFVSVSARLCISEDVKAIIEVREPNVHQFFPIELSRHTGDRTEKSYFLLNILTQLDSIVPEKSDMRWSTDPMTGRGYWGEVAPFRLALRHEAIAGRHIWLEKFRSSAFLSDELVNAIEMQS